MLEQLNGDSFDLMLEQLNSHSVEEFSFDIELPLNPSLKKLGTNSLSSTLSTVEVSTSFENLTAETGPGFGDSNNRYTWSLIEYNGYLFVGTLNLVTGGEVWRTSLDETEWTKVLDLDPEVNGIREIVVYQDQLYAFTTGNPITEPSGWVSSDDGETWVEITGGPLDSLINDSIRSTIVYEDLLYVGTFDSSGAEIWTFDGANWNLVRKFSDEIEAVSDFIEFEGNLYAGVWNNDGSLFFTGESFEVDITPSFGGRRFESNNRGVMDTVVFQDQLYLSTWNFVNGFSLFRTADPLTGQWEIVTRNGFGDRDNAYGWSMAVYDDPLTAVEGDELYLGVFNSGFFDGNGTAFDGLAQLYSTTDGDNWEQVPLPDLGAFTWGIRNVLVTTTDQLVIGTATNYLVSEEEANPGELGTQVLITDL